MTEKKPSDCNFWDKGMCTHEDAPPNDKRCIGMGDEIKEIVTILACCAGNLKAEKTREGKRNCLNAHAAQLQALFDKRVEGIIQAYDKYVKVLGDEIQEMSGLAVVHGWKSSRIKLGKKCREDIEALKSKIKEGGE